MSSQAASDSEKWGIIVHILAKGKEQIRVALGGDRRGDHRQQVCAEVHLHDFLPHHSRHSQQIWEEGCKREYDRLRDEWDASGRPDWDRGNEIFWTVYEMWDDFYSGWLHDAISDQLKALSEKLWQPIEAARSEREAALSSAKTTAQPPAKPQGQKIEGLAWTLIGVGIMLNLCALGWIPFVSQRDWQQDLIAQDLEPPGFWPSVLPLLMVAAGIALLVHLQKAEKNKLAPRCPTCGQQVSRSARRCPYCERSLSPQDHAEEPE